MRVVVIIMVIVLMTGTVMLAKPLAIVEMADAMDNARAVRHQHAQHQQHTQSLNTPSHQKPFDSLYITLRVYTGCQAPCQALFTAGSARSMIALTAVPAASVP